MLRGATKGILVFNELNEDLVEEYYQYYEDKKGIDIGVVVEGTTGFDSKDPQILITDIANFNNAIDIIGKGDYVVIAEDSLSGELISLDERVYCFSMSEGNEFDKEIEDLLFILGVIVS